MQMASGWKDPTDIIRLTLSFPPVLRGPYNGRWIGHRYSGCLTPTSGEHCTCVSDETPEKKHF